MILMKKQLVIFLLFFTASCSSYSRITTAIKPVERADVEVTGDCAIIRTLYYDSSVEMLTPGKISSMNLTSLFNKSRLRKTGKIFAVMIHNTSEEPIQDVQCAIYADGKKVPPLNGIEMENTLYAPRRIVSSEFSVEKIDFDLSSSLYYFNFIVPDDRILYIFCFNDFTVERNSFKLSVELLARGIKKTVDFDFRVTEHRHFD
jgi:hypothetical protein